MEWQKRKCLNLFREYAAAYDIKFKENPPSEKEKTRLRRITLRLREDAIIFEMYPDIKQR